MKKILYTLISFSLINCTEAKNTKQKDEKIAVVKQNAAADVDTQLLNEAYKAQVDSNYKPPQQPKPNIEKIPDFSIKTVDGKTVTQVDIKRNKPVMFMYFSPDCSHCHDFMKLLQPKLKELADYQIFMITWTSQETLDPFYKEYKLAKYKNIIVGTEGTSKMLIQAYYQIKETPFVALYDKHGKFIKEYPKAPKVDDLLSVAKGKGA